MHPVLRRSSRLQSKRKRSHSPPPTPVHIVPANTADADDLVVIDSPPPPLVVDDHDDVHPPNPKRRRVDVVVNSPALQPVSYSRFPRRGRSPLSTDPSLPSSSTPTDPQPSTPSSPPTSSSFPSLPFSRRRRNVYTENNGRIPSLWKYICVERIETLYYKYGYENVVAAENSILSSPTHFDISTPATYDTGTDISFSQEDDEEEDVTNLDDIDRQILQTLQDPGLLDVDAIGEIDPELVDQFSSFDSQKPSLPIPFPPLSSIQVPGLDCAVSDDVVIGPINSKLGRGTRTRFVSSLRGSNVIEYKSLDQYPPDDPMGRGTPIDVQRRADWTYIPTFALEQNWVNQEWNLFLDSIVRIVNPPCPVVSSPDIYPLATSLPNTVSEDRLPPTKQHMAGLLRGSLFDDNMSIVAPAVPVGPSSTLSCALG
ncbi:hypothetical protein BDM02DRAFT_3112475 [Thelephora ganbajun]|uniref:Uncharacterized protein n=1 Tax=Thelephora ganbajun TaxID=370292 RepID=A0ACB6ZKX4_THEGA|nr:hypothetical protein BDM02DRAFT_3112475 [Thelephora ganbajun]